MSFRIGITLSIGTDVTIDSSGVKYKKIESSVQEPAILAYFQLFIDKSPIKLFSSSSCTKTKDPIGCFDNPRISIATNRICFKIS